MKKLLLFAMLLATVAMTSCSKSASAPTLVGKWKLVTDVYKVGTYTTTTTGAAADYVDFKSNGIAESYIGGQSTTVSYTINGSNVTIDGDTYAITSLTSTNATLYYTYGTGSSKIEETITLRK